MLAVISTFSFTPLYSISDNSQGSINVKTTVSFLSHRPVHVERAAEIELALAVSKFALECFRTFSSHGMVATLFEIWESEPFRILF